MTSLVLGDSTGDASNTEIGLAFGSQLVCPYFGVVLTQLELYHTHDNLGEVS
jgi:hypothetical protein